MQTILVQSFPNREVRVTLTREKSGRPFDYSEPPSLTFAQNSEPRSPRTVSPRAVESVVSSETLNTSRLRPGFGLLPSPRPFSTYGRRQLLRAGGALEEVVDYKDCLFLTMTVPGSTRDAFKAIAAWSSWIVDRFKSWLSKRLTAAYSMYVWEWQKRGALHLHYVIHCSEKAIGNAIINQLQTQWSRMLDSVCQMSGIDVWRKNERFTHANDKSKLQVRGEWVKKSVAAYLAKYTAKGGDPRKSTRANLFPPARWYGVSRPLNAELKARTVEKRYSYMPDSRAFASYEDCLSVLQSNALKSYEYRHKVGNGKTTVAYINKEELCSIVMKLNHQIYMQVEKSSEQRTALNQLIVNGLHLMMSNSIWHDWFYKNADTYVKGLVLKWSNSESLSALDMTFLLDALAYSLRYCLRTRLRVSSRESVWLNSVEQHIQAALQNQC